MSLSLKYTEPVLQYIVDEMKHTCKSRIGLETLKDKEGETEPTSSEKLNFYDRILVEVADGVKIISYSPKMIMFLAQVSCEHSVIRVGECVFMQVKGVAQGAHLSSLQAVLALKVQEVGYCKCLVANGMENCAVMHSSGKVRYMDDMACTNMVYVDDFSVMVGSALKVEKREKSRDCSMSFLDAKLHVVNDDGVATLQVGHFSKHKVYKVLQEFPKTETFFSSTPLSMLYTYYGSQVLSITEFVNDQEMFMEACINLLKSFMDCRNNYKLIIPHAKRVLARRYPGSLTGDHGMSVDEQEVVHVHNPQLWHRRMSIEYWAESMMDVGKKYADMLLAPKFSGQGVKRKRCRGSRGGARN